MRSLSRVAGIVLALVSFALFAGCAGSEVREYQRDLAPLVGRAPLGYFLDRYGEPDKRTRIDASTEVLEFTVDDASYGGRGGRASVDVTTRLSLTFKDGVLAGWRVANEVR